MFKIVDYRVDVPNKDIHFHQRLRPRFKEIEDLDRIRNIMLGLPVPYLRGIVEYGYVKHPDNPKMLEPIDAQFAYLVDAKHYLEESSFREVARWLSRVGGRKINHSTLFYIMSRRTPDDRAKLPRAEREKLRTTQ